MKEISVARGTAVVSVLTVASRVLGFIKDLLIAKGFGSSVYADCFFVAFRIPNLLRSLIAEGALSSAFVPVFADAVKVGKQHRSAVFRQILGFLLILSSFICALTIIYADSIVAAFAPGFLDNQELYSACVNLTRYMLPIIICVSLVAMFNAALNTLGNFGASAWAQIWMNLTLIVGAVFAMYYDSYSGVQILAWSALIGSIIQVIVQLPALNRNSLLVAPDFRILNSQVLLLLKLMLPAILGATVYQLGIFINTILASFLNEGSVSWLYYADRIIQFPLGTFSIALGSVLLPALALSYSDGKEQDFSSKTFAALGHTSFLMLPFAVFVFLFAEKIVQVLYQRGSFNSHDTIMTAYAVQAYACGLWAISSYGILSRTFIARKNTTTATLVGIGSLVLNILISLLCIGSLNSQAGLLYELQAVLIKNFPSWQFGHIGLSLASALASNFAFILLCILSAKHLPTNWRNYILTSWLSFICSLIVALIILNTLRLFNLSAILELIFALFFGCILYLPLANIFKIKEARQISSILKAKLTNQLN